MVNKFARLIPLLIGEKVNVDNFSVGVPCFNFQKQLSLKKLFLFFNFILSSFNCFASFATKSKVIVAC